MIYAIPHNRNCIANHFMKANQFAFINHESVLLHNMENPAADRQSTCQSKKTLLSLIGEMKADAVIVRNIGERALGKLLAANIRVYQVASQAPLSQVINSPMKELTDATQGRPSNNHKMKGGCSHEGTSCGCGSATQDHHCSGTAHSSNGIHLHNGGKKGQAMKRSFHAISSLRPLNK